MPTEIENALHRFEVYSRQVLAPAAYRDAVPLDAEVFQSADPISYSEALKQPFARVGAGFRWGPVWSTAWFRLRGRMTQALAGQTVVLRFSTGTEATLWVNGVPHCGLDVNHEAVRLSESARGDEAVELFVEAACNRPFGVLLFPWEDPEEHRRWSEERPGRLQRCELAAYDEIAWRLWQTFEFARGLLRALPEDDAFARPLQNALERVTRLVHPGNATGVRAAALATLSECLAAGADRAATRCTAVGHAHIDTAWLWRTRESRRKCLRTFSTALRLMELHPGFRFLCSQPQQYAWVEADAPTLFAEIAARVREGRWEPVGAMWVEPDCNLPSGESLVRQVLHGARYFQERFGADLPQRILYLPDTFGFCPALPQIMRLSGLNTFITNKLSWNDTTEFPHLTFVWRGLDGSEVLAHHTPGGDYNSDNRPEMLLKGHRKAMRLAATAGLDPADDRLWLQPFGYGDGGGGPNEATILRADLSHACPGLPVVAHGSAHEFCERLHGRRAARMAAGQDYPLWSGELYLEYHRGTYTSQAWLKQANRALEGALRTAEWLTFFGPRALDADRAATAQRDLDRAWKLLLLNQFHDILPGSSIPEVYDDARAELNEVRATADRLMVDGLTSWSAARGGPDDGRWWVANPQSRSARGVVEAGNELRWVREVPAMGIAPMEAVEARPTSAVRANGRTLSNGLVELTIGDCGRITRLRDLRTGRLLNAPRPDGSVAPLNELVLYPDVPGHYDAWEIVRHDRQPGQAQEGPAERVAVSESHPLRAAIEVTRRLGAASQIVQRYVLEADAARVDIRTRIDWHESSTLLRARFPVAVQADFVTCETAFGHTQRPTHANTPFEQARFEFPAHRWVDLSEPGCGVALLNHARYGHSCHGNVLGLSLLRSPVFPDPKADRGLHEFTYSLAAHGGDWRTAGVDGQAEALNTPLIVWKSGERQPAASQRPVASDEPPVPAPPWAPLSLEVDGSAGIEVVACKWAESPAAAAAHAGAVHGLRVLRLVETHGGHGTISIRWGWPVSDVAAVDLLERPLAEVGVSHDAARGVTRLDIGPFQIRSLALATS